MKKRPIKSLKYAERRIRELEKIVGVSQQIMREIDDCALFARAVCQGVARWEFFTGDTQRGEVCVRGLRHSTHLSEYGCPALHDHLRLELRRAIRPVARDVDEGSSDADIAWDRAK